MSCPVLLVTDGQRSQKVSGSSIIYLKKPGTSPPPGSLSVCPRLSLPSSLQGILKSHHLLFILIPTTTQNNTHPSPPMTQFEGDEGVSEDHCEYHRERVKMLSLPHPSPFQERSAHTWLGTHTEAVHERSAAEMHLLF